MKNNKISLVQIVILGIFTISSASCNSSIESTATLRELQQNQAKWESLQISDYQIKVYLDTASTVHPEPWTIEVRNGNPISIIDNNGADMDSDEEAFSVYDVEHYFTIPGWFQYIKETEKYWPEIQVEYDSTYGFPVSVYVPPPSEPCCYDGYTIGIADFKVLP